MTIVATAPQQVPMIAGGHVAGSLTLSGVALACAIVLYLEWRKSDRLKFLHDRDGIGLFSLFTGTVWVAAGSSWASLALGVASIPAGLLGDGSIAGTIGAVLLTAGAVKLLLHLAMPYLGWIAIGITAVWIVAALLVAPEALPAKDNVDELEKTTTSVQSPAQVIAQFVQAIAKRRGQHGVHLDDLLPYLPGIDRRGLLAALREAGIPVKEQLKLRTPNGRQRNRQGVRVEDIPTHLLGDEAGAVVRG